MGRLNQKQESEVKIDNFSGGYAGAKAIGNLQINEAQDLDNIVILPGGTGFRNLEGTKQVSPDSGSSQNLWVYSLGLWASRIDLPGTVGANDDLRVINLARRFTDSGSTDDVSVLNFNITDLDLTSHGDLYFGDGTVTFDTLMTVFPFNDNIIITSKQAFTISGGNSGPVKIDLALGGSLAALQTGTAPLGQVGIGWNNRCWIGNTSADTSKLYYSVLNDETDWSGTGSGFVNPDPDDSDELVALTPISNNVLLYFKQNAIYQVVGRSDPFAVFKLFSGVGCIGKDAIVNVDGMVYFITPKGQMRVTDGSKVYDDRDIPNLSNADDLWAQIDVDRRPFIRGTRHTGRDFDWVIWLVSLGSGQATNDEAIIWDLKNQCWLRCTNGFKAHTIASSPEGRTFLGGNDGARIFEIAVTDYHKDDTRSTAIYDGNNRIIAPTDSETMDWKWRSDDYALSLKDITQVREVNVMAKYDASGTLDLNYRYDGQTDSSDISKTLDSSSVNHSNAVYRPLGRGDTFGFELNSNSEVDVQISKISLVGKQSGTKDPGVR